MSASAEQEEKAPHDEDVARTVARVLEEHEARRRDEEQAQKAKAERKERLTTRVSVAALALTVLLSFLGFVRAERGSASADAEAEAALASSEAESSWVYYQTKNEQRAAYRVADDTLFREVEALPPGDPRVALADVHHTEYLAHIYEISNDCRHLFSRIQDRRKFAIEQRREAARVGRHTRQYDIGTRVLTLAVVLLSVSLLASRELLFWAGIGVAFLGAAIAINGYFLFL